MNRGNVMDEKLLDIIQYVSPYESEIGYNTYLKEDLGFSSLKMVELILEIEKVYDIELDDNDLDVSKINTVKDLENLVCEYLK